MLPNHGGVSTSMCASAWVRARVLSSHCLFFGRSLCLLTWSGRQAFYWCDGGCRGELRTRVTCSSPLLLLGLERERSLQFFFLPTGVKEISQETLSCVHTTLSFTFLKRRGFSDSTLCDGRRSEPVCRVTLCRLTPLLNPSPARLYIYIYMVLLVFYI